MDKTGFFLNKAFSTIRILAADQIIHMMRMGTFFYLPNFD